MLSNSLEPMAREKIGKFLKKYGVMIVEGYKSLSELSKEIAEKNYEILYSAEADINGQHIISVAVVWPKSNGIPSDKIRNRAQIFGQDHFSVFLIHEMTKAKINKSEKKIKRKKTYREILQNCKHYQKKDSKNNASTEKIN